MGANVISAVGLDLGRRNRRRRAPPSSGGIEPSVAAILPASAEEGDHAPNCTPPDIAGTDSPDRAVRDPVSSFMRVWRSILPELILLFERGQIPTRVKPSGLLVVGNPVDGDLG